MRAIHILTDAAQLAPVGGIEVCTLDDVTALAGRGHRLDVLFGVDGPQRGDYARAGATLSGPFSFGFDFTRPARSLAAFRPAVATVRRLRPDVLWLNRAEHVPWAQALSRLTGVPVVCHLHHAPNFTRFRGEVRVLYAGVRRFVAVSDFTRAQWVERGIHADRIDVIPNALPPGRYPPGGPEESSRAREALGLPAGVPVALACGALTAQKGVDTLLSAWPRVLATHPDALLLLVGGPSPAQDPALAALLGRIPEKNVRIFSFHSDLVRFYHAADAVVSPSRLPESFGRVVLEALATGRPAVASRVGAVPEILAGPMDRFLVEPGDAAGLARLLEPLLAWRRDETRLGEECAAWAARRFPYAEHIRRLERVLAEHSRGWASGRSRGRQGAYV